MKRVIELTISNCRECPYRVKFDEYDYACTRKSLSNDFIDQGTGFAWIKDLDKWEWELDIPGWCTLPFEVLV